ncbi:MAG TPA: DUF4159 domain-containing protein [Terriglobia bacterium]|nr:DUF4159 domain-containing protein [Terriglobia bacterium]
MNRFAPAALALILTAAGALLSQEDLRFLGKYEDARGIPKPPPDRAQFVFTRLIYNGRIPRYYKNWYTDYPKGDRQLIEGLKRLTDLSIADQGRVVAINDPELFQYPFVYSSEVGQMVLNPDDAAIMREYLLRGGFWFQDDFWGSSEWASMSAQMKKVFPEFEIRDIPRDHPIFHTFFDIDKVMQIPSLAYVYTRITYEQDGFVGECKGIFDEKGRLMVIINHNTDLGDAYESADDPEYPLVFSGFAYRHALNIILYALSH